MTRPLPALPTPLSLVNHALQTSLWPGPRLTLIALGATFDISTGTCQASDAELSAMTGYTAAQVREHLFVLESWHVLQRGDGPGTWKPCLPLRAKRARAGD